MPQVVKHIRSAVAGKVPTTAELELGVIGINTNDGKVFIKKDDGTPSIVEVTTPAASTSTAGKVQLEDSTSSTSTTKAATPNSVKAAYDLANGKASASHTHGNITNTGAIGTTAGLSVITTTDGVLTTGTFGTTAGTFCEGNDSRLTGSSFPSGTAMVFVQTSAPTGWTKSTTHNDKALRVVSGTASSGGSTAFSSVFASRTPSGSISSTTATGTVGSTTLTTSQIPSHAHDLQRFTGSAGTTNYLAYTSGNSTAPSITVLQPPTASTGGGGSHNHSFSGDSHNHTFTGDSLDFAVQYVDVIIATKN